MFHVSATPSGEFGDFSGFQNANTTSPTGYVVLYLVSGSVILHLIKCSGAITDHVVEN
jgi:hypothetical protein